MEKKKKYTIIELDFNRISERPYIRFIKIKCMPSNLDEKVTKKLGISLKTAIVIEGHKNRIPVNYPLINESDEN